MLTVHVTADEVDLSQYDPPVVKRIWHVAVGLDGVRYDLGWFYHESLVDDLVAHVRETASHAMLRELVKFSDGFHTPNPVLAAQVHQCDTIPVDEDAIF